MTANNVIGERLRLLREEKGYSQSELAEKMNLNRMTINNYENGKRTPDIGFAAAAAEHFSVTLEYLTGKSQFRNREDMLSSVRKADRLMDAIEKIPQVEGQQMLALLAELLETADEHDANTPVLIALINVITEFNRLLASYAETDENIVRNVAELRWQKIQPPLIQWTCLEKTKAINENALTAANGIYGALALCGKMLSKKLLKTLEVESDK